MGMERMETRLVREYVAQRIEVVVLKTRILTDDGQATMTPQMEISEATLDGRKSELQKLYDILGGFDDEAN